MNMQHLSGLLLFLCQALSTITGKEVDYQSLYRRIPGTYLKAIPQKVIDNVTVGACAHFCAMEAEFECKSFDIDNQNIECHLHNHTHTEPLVGLQHSMGFDHYRTNYERLFNRIPNHVISMRHNRNIRDLTVEECARRCILEMSFKCQGFDYETQRHNCWLTDKVAHEVLGLKPRANTDFYERKTNGALSRFINYGYGSLQPIEGVQTHGKIVLGVNLDACAQLCLAETSFPCASFDYVFGEQSCQLSQYIAANVHGMRTDFSTGYKVMHYEVIGDYMTFFYPTPYASVLAHNDRTIRKITPETCARKCLEEREFVCRSFDYQIKKGTCLLSHVTGSDAGGLYTPEGIHVHHFEMKPSLDCGGDLQKDKGSLASPNWPRPYHHHLNCTWRIRVPDFKIIRLDIYHLDLGWQTDDTCSQDNDVLRISEKTNATTATTCVRNHQSELSTVTNDATVTFTTNADNDALGFRIFYKADWPCNVNLTRDNGQLASPRWPSQYPADVTCSWRIEAPEGATILLRFTSVELEDHTASNCRTAYDKIELYDGEFTTSNYMKTLCGNGATSLITSASNVVHVIFVSDSRVQAKGFHASYTFVRKTTTSTTATTTPSQVTSTSASLSPSTVQSALSYSNQNKQNGDMTKNHSSNVRPTRVNSTKSVQMAMHGHDVNNKEDMSKVVELTAIFIEPLNTDSTYNEDNDTGRIDGTPSDDIGRGNAPDVRYEKDADAGNSNEDLQSLVIGVIIAFMSIIVVMSLAIILVCRYYRRRQPKIRRAAHHQNHEENMYLWDQNRNTGECEAEFKDEADVTDAARLPLPRPHSPVPDVEFLNPLYVDSINGTQSRAADGNNQMAENQSAVTNGTADANSATVDVNHATHADLNDPLSAVLGLNGVPEIARPHTTSNNVVADSNGSYTTSNNDVTCSNRSHTTSNNGVADSNRSQTTSINNISNNETATGPTSDDVHCDSNDRNSGANHGIHVDPVASQRVGRTGNETSVKYRHSESNSEQDTGFAFIDCFTTV